MRRRTIRVTAACTAAASALLIRTAPLHSQMPEPLPAAEVDSAPRLTLNDAFVQDTLDRTPEMIGGGLLGGALGLALGGVLGYGLETRLSSSCYDYCGLGGAVLGGAVGESLGMAFGVHAGNQRRGSYAAAVVGPIGVVVGGVVLGSIVGGAPSGLVIALSVPALQLFTSIRGERAAARRRTAPPEP
ncbi:MAG TPA: hypothetical protein VK933_12635 [Longimicrobiales bacterium]|nr:hypothetical protein [Longimicrobiales bacterium]